LLLLLAGFIAGGVFAETLTVTFNSNGGSAVPGQTVNMGGTVSRPADPVTTRGGATLNRFRGWFLDNGTFERAFNFNSRIVQDITLYADWGYRVGDTGPGGGKVFFAVPGGFAAQGRTAYYLEAAPRNSGNARWDEAAGLCGSALFGGKGDWFLPSLEELQLAYQNRVVAGLTSGNVWSSSQVDENKAWMLNFSKGQQRARDKRNSAAVRAIRAF
jgi:hypothetical protein